ARGRLEALGEVGVGLWLVVVNYRRHHRHQHEHTDDHEARSGHRARDQSPPGRGGRAPAPGPRDDDGIDACDGGGGRAPQSYLIRGSTAAYRRSVKRLTVTTMTAMNRVAPCTMA